MGRQKYEEESEEDKEREGKKKDSRRNSDMDKKKQRERERGRESRVLHPQAPKKETELILLFPHCNTEHGEKETRQKWRPENNKNQCLTRRKSKT